MSDLAKEESHGGEDLCRRVAVLSDHLATE